MARKMSPMARNEKKLEKNWRKYGESYGFPACCIDAFCKGKQCHGDDYFSGSGFLRGPCCINKDPKEVLEQIWEDRQYKNPFPFDHHDDFTPQGIIRYFYRFLCHPEYREHESYVTDSIDKIKRLNLFKEMSGWATIVGSRDIKSEEAGELYLFTSVLLNSGLGISTGCATGSDRASYMAYYDWSLRQEVIPSPKLQMWLPRSESRGFKTDDCNFFSLNNEQKRFARAELIRAGISWFDNMPPYAQEMYLRNVYQVWLRDYSQTSLIIYCANEKVRDKPEGGTGVAVRVARANKIPRLNIRLDVDREILKKLMLLF